MKYITKVICILSVISSFSALGSNKRLQKILCSNLRAELNFAQSATDIFRDSESESLANIAEDNELKAKKLFENYCKKTKIIEFNIIYNRNLYIEELGKALKKLNKRKRRHKH